MQVSSRHCPKFLIKWKDKTQNRHSSDILNAVFSFLCRKFYDNMLVVLLFRCLDFFGFVLFLFSYLFCLHKIFPESKSNTPTKTWRMDNLLKKPYDKMYLYYISTTLRYNCLINRHVIISYLCVKASMLTTYIRQYNEQFGFLWTKPCFYCITYPGSN